MDTKGTESQTIKDTQHELDELYSLLEKGRNIDFSRYKEVALVLGNTGSGKTTFTQFITSNDKNLRSMEVSEGAGDYVIIDSNNKISNSTIDSKTLLPEEVVDVDNGLVYVDCPGFSDTRSVAYDIASTYFVKKAIDSSRNLKLVFLVNYPSVRKGVDRGDFLKLLKHAVDLVTDLDKFEDGIALIVTKVDNLIVRKNGEYILVPDNLIINNIAAFLLEVKDSLSKRYEDSTIRDNIFYEKALKFVQILLKKENEEYVKLGIFRRPDEEGLISENSILQKGKTSLMTMLNNMPFIPKENASFGFTVSEQSKNRISDLGDGIKLLMKPEIESLIKNIEEFFFNLEKTVEFQRIRETISVYKRQIIQLNERIRLSSSDREILQYVFTEVDTLKMELNMSNVLNILKQNEYLEFLEVISQKKFKPSTDDWSNLTNITIYLNYCSTFYDLLYNIHAGLAEYTIQTRKYSYDVNVMKTLRKPEIKLNDTPLKPLLSYIYEVSLKNTYSEKEYTNLLNMLIKETHLKRLLDLLISNLRSGVQTECSDDTFRVKGQFVLFSEVVELIKSKCPYSRKKIEVHASNTIFIDADLKNTVQQQIFILAPKWNVIGNRKIILDGSSPSCYSTPATAGDYPGGRGHDGVPGLPGSPGGNFFGLGMEFINSEALTMSVNGGQGGCGQNGGMGGDGYRRPNTITQDSMTRRTLGFLGGFALTIVGMATANPVLIAGGVTTAGGFAANTAYNIHKDKQNVSPGRGGDGGAGGYGGKKGNVIIIGLYNEPKFTILRNDGRKGADGLGGEGGIIKGHEAGSPGIPGNNHVHLHSPDNAKDFYKTPQTINTYKVYMQENLYDDFRWKELTTLLNLINNHVKVEGLYNKDGYINELMTLEKDTKIVTNHNILSTIYKTLFNRVVKAYGRSQEKTMLYILAAISSKIWAMYNKHDNNLNSLFDNIQNLKEDESETTAIQSVENHKEKILKKVKELNNISEATALRILEKDSYISKQSMIVTQKMGLANSQDEILKYQNQFIMLQTEKMAFRKLFASAEVVGVLCFWGEIMIKAIESTNYMIGGNTLDIKSILPSSIESYFEKLGKLKESSKVELTESLTLFQISNSTIVSENLQKLNRIVDDMVELDEKSILLKKYIKREVSNFETIKRLSPNIYSELEDTTNAVRFQVIKFINNFEVPELLLECSNRLNEALMVLVDVYDEIKHYEHGKTMIDYIKHLKTKSLDSAEISIRKVTRQNVILHDFERFVETFQKSVFPLAESNSKILSFPEDKTSNWSVLLSKIKQQMTLALNSKNQSFLQLKEKTFYIWKNACHQNAITDLLNGKEVWLKSDITQGVPYNGVKFYVIGLEFKALNKELQSELENALKGFTITLTHQGNSYFKCDNAYYRLTSEKISISYSFEKDKHGEPLYTNDAYKKNKLGDFKLSPYALWKIQISNDTTVGFETLMKFGKYIDVHLTGKGEYLSEKADLCGEKLDQFYNHDKQVYKKYLTFLKRPKIEEVVIDEQKIPHAVKFTRRRREVIGKSSGTTLSSPLNNAVNWLKAQTFSAANSIMGLYKTSSISTQSKTYTPIFETSFSNLTDIHLNSTLMLADFFLRKKTKVKPFETKSQSHCPIEVQGEVLRIISTFESILEAIPGVDVDFDPISLQKKLVHIIVNGSYAEISKTLCDSISTQNQELVEFVMTKLDKALMSDLFPKPDVLFKTQDIRQNYVDSYEPKILGASSFDSLSFRVDAIDI